MPGAVGRDAARHLRRLARDAAQHGSDGTDYRNTGTSSFLEHYSQRLSAANVMHGAAEGLKAINRAAAKDRIARKRRSDHGEMECEARVGSRALVDAPV